MLTLPETGGSTAETLVGDVVGPGEGMRSLRFELSHSISFVAADFSGHCGCASQAIWKQRYIPRCPIMGCRGPIPYTSVYVQSVPFPRWDFMQRTDRLNGWRQATRAYRTCSRCRSFRNIGVDPGELHARVICRPLPVLITFASQQHGSVLQSVPQLAAQLAASAAAQREGDAGAARAIRQPAEAQPSGGDEGRPLAAPRPEAEGNGSLRPPPPARSEGGRGQRGAEHGGAPSGGPEDLEGRLRQYEFEQLQQLGSSGVHVPQPLLPRSPALARAGSPQQQAPQHQSNGQRPRSRPAPRHLPPLQPSSQTFSDGSIPSGNPKASFVCALPCPFSPTYTPDVLIIIA